MRTLYCFLICLIAVPALAQNAGRVRAIEHPNFSRLVFEVSPDTTWTSRQTGREIVLILNGVKQKFEAGALFDRMSRSRILSFSQQPGSFGLSIELELGCDCEVIVEKLAGNQLALDVWRQGSRSNATTSKPVSLPSIPVVTEHIPDHEPELDISETQIEPVHVEEPAEDLRLAGSIAAEARQLEEEIARIAAEGYLDLNVQNLPDRGEAKSNRHDLEEDLHSGPNIPLQAPSHSSEIPFVEDGTQTRIGSTLIDTAPDPAQESQPDPSAAECRSFNLSASIEASSGTPPADRLGQLRASLINVDGSVNEEAWRSLARYYISIGFGSEAIVTLKELPEQEITDAVLVDIARIVEDLRPMGSMLSRDEYCSTELGIWRLASGKIPGEYSDSAVLAELSYLPYTIRKAVGLMIFRHIEGANPELARSIQNLIERTPETEVPASQEEIVKHLTQEAMLEVATGENEMLQKLPNAHDAGLTVNDAAAHAQPSRMGDPETELDLAIASRQLSGTSPGLSATLTLAKYEAETGNLLEAVTLLNKALEDYEFGSLEIYQTGTDLLLEFSQVPEIQAQFVLAALSGRKFLLTPEHQQLVEARFAEIGLPNLTLFR